MDVPKESITVEKKNSTVSGPYKATFAGTTIIVWDAKADIEEGDVILRKLPSGRLEKSFVTEAQFYAAMDSIGAHYQIKFTKNAVTSPRERPAHNISIYGAQAVQIGDHNTQHILNSIQSLVAQIESSNAPLSEREEAKSLLKKFLAHPLLVSILGAAAGAMLG